MTYGETNRYPLREDKPCPKCNKPMREWSIYYFCANNKCPFITIMQKDYKQKVK